MGLTTPIIRTTVGKLPPEVRLTGSHRFDKVQLGPADRLVVDRADLVRVDLSRLRGDSFQVLGGSRFVECDFSRTSFRHSVVLGAREQSLYENCSFDGATLHGCGSNVRMVGCRFRDARLTDWFGTALELIDCQFDGCRIERSKFWGRPHGIPPNLPERSSNEFVGNDFSRADFRDVSFAGGINLLQQKMPLGANYRLVRDLAGAVDRARSAVALWADEGTRIPALRRLSVLSEVAAQGQDQALIDTRTWAMPQTAVEELLKLLGATPPA